MRLTRIHCPLPLHPGTDLTLSDNATSHLVRVLRLQPGAAFILFDGHGHEHHATLQQITGKHASARVGEALINQRESPLRITLIQGISRGERMDWTLQKATELGVHAIEPVITTRSVVRLDAAQTNKKQEHWQQIVISACEQSGRSVVPVVTLPCPLAARMAQRTPALRLILSPHAEQSMADLARPDQAIELLIGPEGGLDDAEIALAAQHGFIPVRLGPRVLRTETAAVVALTAIQTLWGDLG